MAKKKSGNAALYVICESGFEYNDEIYHRPESEGGTPVLASADKDKIDKACHDMNFKKFLNEFSGMRSYFYEVDEKFSEEAIELLVKNKVLVTDKYSRGEHGEWSEKVRWQEIPADDLEKIYKGCQLSWFEVYEIDSPLV
jgi:hypothetical protein